MDCGLVAIDVKMVRLHLAFILYICFRYDQYSSLRFVGSFVLFYVDNVYYVYCDDVGLVCSLIGCIDNTK